MLTKKTVQLALTSLMLATSSTAWAQEGASAKPEKISVTGSRIKKIDVEGTSPLTVIDRETIDQSGVSSVSDLLRNYAGSTANFSGGGSSVAAGTAAANLRGLGISRTLVLVDGVRLPKHPELGAVDLNSIPMAAIERVEVLRQSAAAVYGTDAIGGVINIITRKDFTGQQYTAEVRRTKAGGAASHAVQGVVGFNSERSSSTLILSYTHQDRLGTNERDAFKERTSGTGFPGSYSAGSGDNLVAFPVEGCPNFEKSGDTITQDSSCLYNYNDHNTLLPEIDRFSGLYNLNYRLGNEMNLESKFLATHQVAKSQLRPELTNSDVNSNISQAAIDGMSDERFNRLFPGFNGAKPTEGGVDLRLRLSEFGNAITEKEATLLGANFSLSGYVNPIWEWKAGLSAAGSKTTSSSSNKLRRAELGEAIASGEYIPWDTEKDFASIANRVVSESYYIEDTRTGGLDVQIIGELGELPAGPIAVAFGAGAQRETYDVRFNKESSNEELLNVAGSGGSGDRNVSFASFETNLPLAEGLQADLAARFDNYSDFGSTLNPQLAIGYQPIQALKLRASAGTAFKAPTLDNLYAARGVSFNSAVDYVYCEQKGISRDACVSDPVASGQFKNIRGGNPDLEAETSKIYSFGLVFQPWQGLSIGADYWRVRSDKLIALRSLQDIIEDDDGSLVTRDADGAIIEVDNRLQNLAKKKRSGVDVELNASAKLASFGLSLRSIGTWYVEDKEQLAGKAETNELGEYGSFKWKLSNILDLDFDSPVGLTLASTSLGKHKQLADDTQSLPQWTRYDAQLRYQTAWDGVVALGVNNITDNKGPRDPSSFGDIDLDFYDVKGLEYYLRVTQNF